MAGSNICKGEEGRKERRSEMRSEFTAYRTSLKAQENGLRTKHP
jgi:hypothetical protein